MGMKLWYGGATLVLAGELVGFPAKLVGQVLMIVGMALILLDK